MEFLPEINYFGRIFHRGRFRPNQPCFQGKTNRSDPTPRWSIVGQYFLHSIQSGRSQVGHKLNPWTPLNNIIFYSMNDLS